VRSQLRRIMGEGPERQNDKQIKQVNPFREKMPIPKISPLDKVIYNRV
jgi:hypothetical protein